ncbi:3-dehydroquinate synthase [uncultured Porphyromonas sp.]|uniref:3-dehydroquinate synthase n=1 Tax=uncultured Porphyromonas sp. TaxID=159274 RepID=UPI0026127D8A|nr:3-dehydroquinate synthase [uncultured Porphyromonas sp.]
MTLGTNMLDRKLSAYIQAVACDRLFILCDEVVAELHAPLITSLRTMLPEPTFLAVPATEQAKGTDSLARVWSWLADEGATRRSVLILIGGGALLDFGGFAAATYMRGIRTINVPTTLLAMVDASVGGKTAIDYHGVKNLIGAFHLPLEVFVDIDFLRTLPIEELLSGYGEIIKHATLMGIEAWREVCRIGDPVALMDEEWEALIAKSIAYKSSIVEADPEEKGLRRILNAGHTVGHALEAYSHANVHRRTLPHGEAVLFGLLIESYITTLVRGGSRDYIRQLMYLARELYSPFIYTCKDYPELIRLMRHDKKNSSGKIVLMGILAPGQVEPIELDDEGIIKEGLDFLRETFGS